MKPLFVLLITTLLSALFIKLKTKTYQWGLSSRIGLSVMLGFTALGHFLFTDGMALMVPDFFPYKHSLVYFTALIELLAAIGIHLARLRYTTAWLFILFLLLMLPANIKACLEHINYQNATFTGPGLSYLWFRIPLQAFFIFWVYTNCLQSKRLLPFLKNKSKLL